MEYVRERIISDCGGTLIDLTEYPTKGRKRISPLRELPLNQVRCRHPSKNRRYGLFGKDEIDYIKKLLNRGEHLLSERTKRSLYELMGEKYLFGYNPDIRTTAKCYRNAKQMEGEAVIGQTPEEVILFDAPITHDNHGKIEELVKERIERLSKEGKIGELESFCTKLAERFEVLPVEGLLYPLVFSGSLKYIAGDLDGAKKLFRQADAVNLLGRQDDEAYLGSLKKYCTERGHE